MLCGFSYFGHFSYSVEDLWVAIYVLLVVFKISWCVIPWFPVLFGSHFEEDLCVPYCALVAFPILATLAILWKICVLLLANGESAVFHSWLPHSHTLHWHYHSDTKARKHMRKYKYKNEHHPIHPVKQLSPIYGCLIQWVIAMHCTDTRSVINKLTSTNVQRYKYIKTKIHQNRLFNTVKQLSSIASLYQN